MITNHGDPTIEHLQQISERLIGWRVLDSWFLFLAACVMSLECIYIYIQREKERTDMCGCIYIYIYIHVSTIHIYIYV